MDDLPMTTALYVPILAEEAVYAALLYINQQTPRPLAARALMDALRQDGYEVRPIALAATPAPLDDYVRVIDVDAWLPQHTGYCANQPEDECSCGVGPEYERMLATAYAATPAPLDVTPEAAVMGTDARLWASEFVRLFGNDPDEGTMLGWFANAIEAGRAATPAPLDVERLALALHNTGLNSIGHKPGFHGRYSDRCICHLDAAQIANEYAAITPKDFSTRIYKENRGE